MARASPTAPPSPPLSAGYKPCNGDCIPAGKCCATPNDCSDPNASCPSDGGDCGCNPGGAVARWLRQAAFLGLQIAQCWPAGGRGCLPLGGAHGLMRKTSPVCLPAARAKGCCPSHTHACWSPADQDFGPSLLCNIVGPPTAPQASSHATDSASPLANAVPPRMTAQTPTLHAPAMAVTAAATQVGLLCRAGNCICWLGWLARV